MTMVNPSNRPRLTVAADSMKTGGKWTYMGLERLRSRAETGACGGWERKATLFAKLSPESNRAYRVGRQALADFPNSVTLVRNRAVGRRE
jgi:hypothetical protein